MQLREHALYVWRGILKHFGVLTFLRLVQGVGSMASIAYYAI